MHEVRFQVVCWPNDTWLLCTYVSERCTEVMPEGHARNSAAERASFLHLAAKEEIQELGNTEPCLGKDRANLTHVDHRTVDIGH